MTIDDKDIAARLGKIEPMTDEETASAVDSYTKLHGKMRPGDLLYRFDHVRFPAGAFGGAFGFLVVRGREITRVIRIGGY